MKRTKKYRDKRVNQSLFSVSNFFMYLLLVSFIVTCCIILFIASSGLSATWVTTQRGAILTLGNVIFLSIMLSIIDNIGKKITIGKPVNRILEATRKVRHGDFSVRIKPIHKKQKTEMDAIIEDFNLMVSELSGIETMKTDFIANVSHEIKTPLAVIQNYSTLLQDPGLSEEQKIEYAKSITSASRRLSDLVTNILKLNKLENQQIYPDVKQYDLSEQLCECMLFFENTWAEKCIDIETDIDDGIIIKADPELMMLVWSNLFSNAFKFTSEGGKVSVSAKKEKGRAVVTVTDTGCGMSENVKEHIFEKFYQGDSSHSGYGNGLGLALVSRVLNISKAEIKVDSEVGVGSTFTVFI